MYENIKTLSYTRKLFYTLLLQTLEAIYDILKTHPFAFIIQQKSEGLITPIDDQSDSNMVINFVPEFIDWQDKITSILNSNSPILSTVPELNSMLLLLKGDKSMLFQYCYGDWITLSLSYLLYSYPPNLSRNDLSRILDSAMQTCPVNLAEQSKEEYDK